MNKLYVVIAAACVAGLVCLAVHSKSSKELSVPSASASPSPSMSPSPSPMPSPSASPKLKVQKVSAV